MNKRKEPENEIPTIENKKHHSIKSIENSIMRNLQKKYKFSSKEESYNNLIVNALIFNKNSHLVSIFKDSMIWDYIDEFLKRYYKKAESFERVPRFASFYKNYLKFFCKPTFVNFTVNGVIQDYNEQKAELYYNQNFKSKKNNDEMEDNEDIEDEKSSKSISKSKIEKTIFNSTIKENIDNNSIITVKTTVLNNESTMILPDNDYDNTIINESGLLNQYSSEQSFVLLMNQMKNNKRKTKNVSASEIPSSITKENNAKKSKFISYTNLCQKKNFQVIKQKNHTQSQFTFKTSYNRSRNNKSNNLVNCLSSTNKNQNSNSNTKFKTFDIQKKNNFLKTQNVENIINRITKQVAINVKPHKKNNYSIDNISSKTKSLSNKKHKNSASNNIKKTKETIIKGIKAKKKIPSIPPSTNEDIMKITLALLMNGSNSSNKNRLVSSGKHIQSVNININNQININNNVQLSPKSINNKIMHNDKVDMNINSNLNHLLHSNYQNSASSNVLPTHNKKSRNKCGSYDINATNTGSINYCSYNTLDKKHFTSFMAKNATKTTTYNSKDKMKNLKFTSHQMINNNGKKIKVIPQKKTFGLQFKNGSSNTGKIATKVSNNNNKK